MSCGYKYSNITEVVTYRSVRIMYNLKILDESCDLVFVFFLYYILCCQHALLFSLRYNPCISLLPV